MQSVRKKASEVIASVALALLIIYLVDVLTTMLTGHVGFLPFSSQDRGLIFGASSIALFIVSFAVSIGVYSKVTATLLIIGGALIGTSVLVSTYITPQFINSFEGTKIVTPPLPQFVGIIILGYAIMGSGIFKAVRKR
jgi:hypothetical protein